MPSSLTFGVMFYCLLIVLLAGAEVVRVATLERRVQAMRRLLLLLIPGLVALFVSLIIGLRDLPRFTARMLADNEMPMAWYAAVQDAGRLHSWVLCFFVLLAVGIITPAIFVLRDLRVLAMTHRLDLAARDEIALASDPRPPQSETSAAPAAAPE